jgi:hypothetical protein
MIGHCVVHDAIDQLQGFGGRFVHDHQGNIGSLRRRDPRDVEKGRHACDDVMTQRGYGPCDLVEANPWPVGDRDAEDALGSHSPLVRCIRPFADSAALETKASSRCACG